jgi:hypothetical protein
MLLLQNAAFVALFRQTLNNKARDLKVDGMEPDTSEGKGADAIAAIFSEVSRDRLSAARKALAYLQQKQDVDELMHAARRMVFVKGNDAHDYKFSSAVLEDYRHISPALRNNYLAASFFYLPGSGAKDNALVPRIRQAFQ